MIEQKTKRQLLVRPTTPQSVGLRGTFDQMAEQMLQCWRLLSRDHDVREISARTGLHESFVSALEKQLWP